MAKMIRQRPTHLPRTVEDHRLRDKDCKEVKLSSPFGKRECLVMLHNMGKTCPHCALCGDEFNGMLHHLQEDAGFCVVGPDDPKTQRAYVKERGWKAKLYSAGGTSSRRDLGFEDTEGRAQPGVSILKKGRDGEISILFQVNVPRDGRAPSVLEVLWMLPEWGPVPSRTLPDPPGSRRREAAAKEIQEIREGGGSPEERFDISTAMDAKEHSAAGNPTSDNGSVQTRRRSS